ncbi:ABC transporter permease [Neoroseomonas oryzicola]|uniref:ABC transporter permease n=1 Tax=Neoroseomonas oryzicola TaxID=535904 RepID=A0A9X9WHB1_9PROT|nr:ABC transporter permease [Neoroseomonas oryzicola]MBR0659721.1 ABC transporter permease [Neoroseomonas oryzicola]NKE17151.1 ABC transporter permease [Neoroseomonas oryzicola]
MPADAPRSAEALAEAARRRRRLENALPWLVIAGMFLVWEAACRLFSIPPFILPAPSLIAESMVKWWQPLLTNAWATLVTTFVGFMMAVVFGLALGVAVGSSVLVYRGLYPLLIAFNSVPKVAVVPILVIWFGAGFWPAVLTAFLISFFPIVVNVATGIATVEPELRDVLRALGASSRDIIAKVGLPRAMPYFFASLKVAITVAFVGSIISETVAANEGIGHLMLVASSRFDVPLVFAGLIVTGIMGVLMYWVAVTIEERTTGWATRGQNDPRLATGG